MRPARHLCPPAILVAVLATGGCSEDDDAAEGASSTATGDGDSATGESSATGVDSDEDAIARLLEDLSRTFVGTVTREDATAGEFDEAALSLAFDTEGGTFAVTLDGGVNQAWVDYAASVVINPDPAYLDLAFSVQTSVVGPLDFLFRADPIGGEFPSLYVRSGSVTLGLGDLWGGFVVKGTHIDLGRGGDWKLTARDSSGPTVVNYTVTLSPVDARHGSAPWERRP